MIWLQENRPMIKSKYPGATLGEIGKKAGEMWKALPSKVVSFLSLLPFCFVYCCCVLLSCDCHVLFVCYCHVIVTCYLQEWEEKAKKAKATYEKVMAEYKASQTISPAKYVSLYLQS